MELRAAQQEADAAAAMRRKETQIVEFLKGIESKTEGRERELAAAKHKVVSLKMTSSDSTPWGLCRLF